MKMTRLLLMLIAIIALSGCGLTVQQKKLLTQYSSAASAVGAQSSTEFKTMQDMVVQANKYNIVINGMETYAPLNALQGDLSDTNMYLRIAAAKALQNYGDLLGQLIGRVENEKLRKASDNMIKGAEKINANAISKDVEKGVQAAVMAVGRFSLEKKKAKAVRKVVLGYKDVIDGLCNALIIDFSADAGGVRQNATAVLEETKMSADEILRAPKLSISDRDVAMNAESFSSSALYQIRDQGELIAKQAAKIRQINNNLVKAFQNGSPNNFAELKEEVQGLVEITKELTE
jgi:hypothetical protein